MHLPSTPLSLAVVGFSAALAAFCLQTRADAQGGAAGAATQRPTFSSGIDLTLVDLRVVDDDGKFVRGLTRDDFKVFEDGKEQAISTLSLVDLPTQTAEPNPEGRRVNRVASDVASNATSAEGRLYLIVLGGTSWEQLATYKAIVRGFVEDHVTENDQVAMVEMSGRLDTSQEFTSNRTRLLERLRRFTPGYGMPGDSTRTLTSLVEWLGQIHGRRKAIVYFTPSVGPIVDWELPTGGVGPPLPPQRLRDLLTSAARANVSFYIMDPTGVPSGPLTGLRLGDDGSVRTGDPDELGFGDRGSLAAAEERRQGLRVLAEATGGFAFTSSNDFASGFARIVEENSSYYILGYVSTSPLDRKFRTVKVEVKKRDLRVHARTGYVAEAPRKAGAPAPAGLAPDLAKVLKSAISVPGLTLSVTATPFRGQRAGMASLAVVVEARGRDLIFAQEDGRFNGALELAIVAAELRGKTKAGERGSLSMKLSQEKLDSIATHGLRFLSTLELKPGNYHLVVAASDAGAGQTRGVVQYDISIPDLSKGRLNLSGIALSSLAESETITNGTNARWKEAGLSPTTVRAFDAGDELRTFVEVYDELGANAQPTEVLTTVTNAWGRSVFTERKVLTRPTAVTTQGLVTSISLKDFVPGEYLLAVEARNPGSPKERALRQIPFTVQRGPDQRP